MRLLSFAVLLALGNASLPVLPPGGNNFNFAGMLALGSNQSIPLVSVTVVSTVLSYATDVSAKLIYKNNRQSPLECEFVFPIASDAAVYKLEVRIGNRAPFQGKVRPREEAMQEYVAATSNGTQAALLESKVGSDDVYRLLVGNIGPNEQATVTIAYAQPMDQNPNTGELSVTLPVVLNPRYVPAHMLNDAEFLRNNFHINTTYVAVSEVSYEMFFLATVDMGSKGPSITTIASGNSSDILDAQILPGGKRAVVNLMSLFNQDHDFQFRMNVSHPPEPTLYVEPGYASSGSKTWVNYDVLGAWMSPAEVDLITPRSGSSLGQSSYQYWILYDLSGSMSGDKFRYQQEALIMILKSLPRDCQFNVVGFEDDYHPIFNTL